MLCPKCKYISYDHLSVCAKCSWDLSSVQQALHGTAANVQAQLFLGSVLKVGAGAAAEEAPPFPLDEVQLDGEAAGELALVADEEAPALEFDEIDMPQLDFATPSTSEEELETALQPPPSVADEEGVPLVVEEVISLAVPPEEVEAVIVSPESVAAEEVAPPPQEVVSVGEGAGELEIDESALALDLAVEQEEESHPVAETKPADAGQEQRTIDLEEIDLSDLTFTGGEEAPSTAPEESREDEGGSVSFDESVDLSLAFGDEEGETQGDAEELSGSDLAPIDLTLMDDALVELTVEPGRDDRSQMKADKQGDGDLELSMEDVTA